MVEPTKSSLLNHGCNECVQEQVDKSLPAIALHRAKVLAVSRRYFSAGCTKGRVLGEQTNKGAACLGNSDFDVAANAEIHSMKRERNG